MLIVGETGTGKELIARAIHLCSARSGPFIAVNCAALPRDLIESELFGYKRGAFSGALTDHLGLFRAATGGTLLLDEITEMQPELQAKLLRVLQEHSVRPVGAVAEISIDVRIIASTNCDAAKLVADGLLRRDLFYRLCVSTVHVPALAARHSDIPALIAHHLTQLNQREAHRLAQSKTIAAEAVAELQARAWPGNVRELFNVIEDAFGACRGEQIVAGELAPAAAAMNVTVVDPAGAVPTFAASERALIEQALVSTGGNKLMASRLLGISRKKLYAKLARYGLCP